MPTACRLNHHMFRFSDVCRHWVHIPLHSTTSVLFYSPWSRLPLLSSDNSFQTIVNESLKLCNKHNTIIVDLFNLRIALKIHLIVRPFGWEPHSWPIAESCFSKNKMRFYSFIRMYKLWYKWHRGYRLDSLTDILTNDLSNSLT